MGEARERSSSCKKLEFSHIPKSIYVNAIIHFLCRFDERFKLKYEKRKALYKFPMTTSVLRLEI